MEAKKTASVIEIIAYVLALLLGTGLIYWAYRSEGFWRDLLLNLGSDMTVATIVFGIYKFVSSRSKVPEHLRGVLSDMASPNPGSSQRNLGE